MKNLLLLLTVALLASCASADKLLETGNYDQLVDFATKKLSGRKKKDEYVRALETGFEKITRRDMATIDHLKTSTDPYDWEDIINIAREIDHRQSKIEPFLPLVSESGYQAKFTFVKTDKIISEARVTAVDLHEKRLVDMVNAARRGNKTQARNAYKLIDHIRSLDNTYYRPELRDEMLALGLNRILISIENNSNAIMPADFERELLRADFANMGSSWDRYYTEVDDDFPVDYKVILRINEILTTHDEWAEHHHPHSKDIVDGWEYVLDERGNVKKDSLGNDIKRDKIVRVNAIIIEGVQTKKALIRTRMDIINAANNVRIYSQPLEFENEFRHVSRHFTGDERALEPHLRQRILPIGYPSDASMIRDAFEGLKPKFFDEVRRANYNI